MKTYRSLVYLWKVIKPIALVFVLSNILIYRFKIDIGKVNDLDFLFTFFGIILGFALTIFSFIISLIEKIKENTIAKYNDDPTKINLIKQKVKALYSEIKDDIAFTFFSLSIVGALYVINYHIPNIHLYNSLYVNHAMFAQCLKLTLFALNIYAIYDLIIISFRLSDTTEVFEV